MKKKYQKPAMTVVLLQQHNHILALSGEKGAKSLGDNDYFYMKDGGFDNGDEDM